MCRSFLNLKPHLHDTTGCQTRSQTGLTTGCIVYTNIQPTVKPCLSNRLYNPVSQPVERTAVRSTRLSNPFDNRFHNRLDVCLHDTAVCTTGLTFPLPSNRHRRCGDRLEGKGENYQVCSVQYCAQQLCTVRCTHI